MPRYLYEGPVMEFEKMLVDNWKGETLAPSKGRAISNLKYQFKKNNNKLPGTKISLPGKLQLVG